MVTLVFDNRQDVVKEAATPSNIHIQCGHACPVYFDCGTTGMYRPQECVNMRGHMSTYDQLSQMEMSRQ